MQNRTRAEEPRDRSQEREQDTRVRIPKIQYRFLKELEQRGIPDEARANALAMADRIRRYPLEPKHVMGSWERFTKTAIEDFKKGAGKSDEHDRQHNAYALLFSSIRTGPSPTNAQELKARVGALDFAGRARGAASERAPTNVRDAAPRQQELIQKERPLADRHR